MPRRVRGEIVMLMNPLGATVVDDTRGFAGKAAVIASAIAFGVVGPNNFEYYSHRWGGGGCGEDTGW